MSSNNSTPNVTQPMLSMREQSIYWTPERLQQMQFASPTDLRFFRDTEGDPNQEMQVWAAEAQFLEELDHQQNGVPQWFADYLDSIDPRHETVDAAYQRFLYATGQENDPSVISFEQSCLGNISCMEADLHNFWASAAAAEWQQRSSLVGGFTSTPQQESWMAGPPIALEPNNPNIAFTNYTELALPKVTTDTQEGYWPDDDQLAKRVLGRDGHWVKQVTQETGAHYIWWNADRGVFQIWGDRLVLPAVLVRLHLHFWLTIRKFDRETYGFEGQREEEWGEPITRDEYAQLWGPHNSCYTWRDLERHYYGLTDNTYSSEDHYKTWNPSDDYIAYLEEETSQPDRHPYQTYHRLVRHFTLARGEDPENAHTVANIMANAPRDEQHDFCRSYAAFVEGMEAAREDLYCDDFESEDSSDDEDQVEGPAPDENISVPHIETEDGIRVYCFPISITDEALLQWGDAFRDLLVGVDFSYCTLLTERGLRGFFQRFPRIEYLGLIGMEHLGSFLEDIRRWHYEAHCDDRYLQKLLSHLNTLILDEDDDSDYQEEEDSSDEDSSDEDSSDEDSSSEDSSDEDSSSEDSSSEEDSSEE